MHTTAILLAIQVVAIVAVQGEHFIAFSSPHRGRVLERQACDSSTCPKGYLCCPSFPGSCCPAGVSCLLGKTGTVQCNIKCTAQDSKCSFGGCCPPGSICDDLNLSCRPLSQGSKQPACRFVWMVVTVDATVGPTGPGSPPVTPHTSTHTGTTG